MDLVHKEKLMAEGHVSGAYIEESFASTTTLKIISVHIVKLAKIPSVCRIWFNEWIYHGRGEQQTSFKYMIKK